MRTYARDGCEFELLQSYRDAYPRPTLGQWFLDDLERIEHVRSGVPPWFANLLPEGPLRDLVANRAGVHPSRALYLLTLLGEDLPGAIRIRGETPPDASRAPIGDDLIAETGPWKFSLAGMQLKFSAQRQGRGLTIPVNGVGGDWILKLPDIRYPQVPRNELATMRWASLSGIEVPEHRLIPNADIQGLPAMLRDQPETDAFAIRRFDRPTADRRVHMEDFAQVLNLPPSKKYGHCNYETLASLVLNIAGAPDVAQFLRRLIFVIASGNGDAHLKNWSLIYPDRVQARLSPAYDLISTLCYMGEDRLALNLGGTKDWYTVERRIFARLADRIGGDPRVVLDVIDSALEDIIAAWHQIERDKTYPVEMARSIAEHLRRLPLLAG